MFRACLCPSSGEQRTRSPEDGHNDARNMLKQKLIINIYEERKTNKMQQLDVYY